MSGEDIRSYTADEIRSMIDRGEDLTDWKHLQTMTEAELEAAIASDPDWADIPRDWINSPDVILVRAGQKQSVVVDSAVADWFRRQGEDYETGINDVLRTYVREHSAT